MDIKKLFLQIISILLVVVVVVCIGTAVKRSGEPEKEYDFSEHNNSSDTEELDNTEEIPDDTETNSEMNSGDESASTTPQNKIMYTTSAVNVRSGPGRGYEWLGRLELGASITAVGDAEGEWQEVIYNGQTAYIAVEYLEVRDESETPDAEGNDNAGTGNTGTGATTTPGETTAPGGTSSPGDTTTPSNPVTPPTAPSEPSNPVTPDEPDAPSEPEEPSNPEEPTTPSEPEIPVEPDTPSEPEEPSGSEGELEGTAPSGEENET